MYDGVLDFSSYIELSYLIAVLFIFVLLFIKYFKIMFLDKTAGKNVVSQLTNIYSILIED